MNLLEIYLPLSTMGLLTAGIFWKNFGTANRILKMSMYLGAIVGGFLSLHALGFALGVE